MISEVNCETFEIKIYIGSVRGYNGTTFTEESLINFIGDFQKVYGDGASAVRVTPTKFVMRDYVEAGYEIGIINYPRFPKTGPALIGFASALAKEMLHAFEQNRISVVMPKVTTMYQAENAEEGPKK
jgi:hypothetical protein